MKEKINIFWFRRDLRLHDNHGLYCALEAELPVLPLFIFDSAILKKLGSNADARVSFIYGEILKIKAELEKRGASLLVLYGKPLEIFMGMAGEYDILNVIANRDYEPYAAERDREVQKFLKSKGIGFEVYKDQVIFEKQEIVKDNGEPYTVFTPYSRKWKQVLGGEELQHYPSEMRLNNCVKIKPFPVPGLKDLGFRESAIRVAAPGIPEDVIRSYAATRDLPAADGTTRLGIHLRFGTVSIRELTGKAREWSETFLNELIWRNFFSTILWHFPQVTGRAFKSQYDFIRWRNNEKEFERWCRGETGYPMVDAGMRELNATGFMHNRVRMVTASFLTKHLLIDWRWGEAYFAEKLLDYDLASNNGNWQWAAGTGCDAAPYFRIFNPETQQKKFDPRGEYIKKWVPEAGTRNYRPPVVEHKFARERALNSYREALK